MAKNIPLRETIKEYIFSTIGVILTALGLVIFLIPNNIAAGGASGLAIILHSIIPLSVGVWMYILNAILFLIAFLIIGFDFSYKTIYCTFLLNFFIDLFDRIINIPTYNGGDLFLAVFFGDILTAIGMAITFSQNASTGGTDILAKIFNKFFSTPMGTTLLIIDFTIGFFAGVAFNPKIGMYSILAIIINGITIDFVLKGLELAITVTIISDNNKPIEEFILTNMGRGFTYLKGKGGYTKKDRDIIFVSIRRRELGELINFVKKVDPNAFMIVNESRYVLGEGFKRNLWGESMKALMIIDMQNDFAKKGGALYFEGAEKVIPKIIDLIKEAKNKNLPIILTQDWHDEDDKEFEIWPKHCIKNTSGAMIVSEIQELLNDYNNVYYIKKTRYSAFYKTDLENILENLSIDEVDVVGLVSNICVLFTVEELRNRDIKVNLYKDGTDSYDKQLHNAALKIMSQVLQANIL